MIVGNPKDVAKHRMRTDHLKTTEPVLLLHICHKSSETEIKKIAQLTIALMTNIRKMLYKEVK